MPRHVTISARKALPSAQLHVRISTPLNPHADTFNPTFPTVVLVPTIWTDSFFFYPQFEDPELSQNYNLVSIDTRGHGLSKTGSLTGSFDWTDVGHDTLAVLDSIGIDTFHLVAQGHGCIAACHIALEAGSRVASLCLVHRPVRTELAVLQPIWPQMINTFQAAVSTRDPELLDQLTICQFEFSVGSFSCPAMDSAKDEVLQMWRHKLLSGELARTAGYLEGLANTRLDIQDAEAMGGVQCPILLLRGTEDGCEPHYEDSEFVEHFNKLSSAPRAAVHVIDMVPRWMTLTSPNIFNPILASHLANRAAHDTSLLSPLSPCPCDSALPSPTTPWIPLTPLPASPGNPVVSISRRPSTPRDFGSSFSIPPPPKLPPGVTSTGEMYDALQQGLKRPNRGSEVKVKRPDAGDKGWISRIDVVRLGL